jgi:carbon-monoxide dehydrogenase medium subunit
VLLSLSDFDLVSANTVAEACSLLQRYGAEARIFAGGTDLLVKMKHKRLAPRVLINIKAIPGLDQIRYDASDGLVIGALATIQSIKDSPVIGQEFPLLAQAAAKMGTLHIRNLGTLGGNLANASPSAEFAPALLTLGATLQCVGPQGSRSIAVENFFVGPGKSALRADELLTEVHVSKLPSTAAGVYLKHSLRRMDVAIASTAVVVDLDGETLRDARIALGAVGPTPFRARAAEAAMKGQEIAAAKARGELFDKVARLASEESLPIGDIRADAAYRRRIVGMIVLQAIEQAVALARSQRPAVKKARAAQ